MVMRKVGLLKLLKVVEHLRERGRLIRVPGIAGTRGGGGSHAGRGGTFRAPVDQRLEIAAGEIDNWADEHTGLYGHLGCHRAGR
jgi:hypothetical protein